jgi:predicted nucleotidyltransferase
MLSNQKARQIAETYASHVKSELGDDLLLVVLFGSTIEGKQFPDDVDVFVSGKDGVARPKASPEHMDLAYLDLCQLKELVQGKGQGNPEFVRRIFLGYGEVLYDASDYYFKINRAFASGDVNYIK